MRMVIFKQKKTDNQTVIGTKKLALLGRS